VPVILMHMQGQPQTMQDDPRYGNVVAEVCSYLAERAHLAMAAGVAREAISLDPGIGFGKTLNHNLALLSNLDGLKALGFPVVLGVSRKRFIQGLDPSAGSAKDRLGGSIAAALAGARAGVDVLRVHDVGQTAQALAVWQAIEERRA
jgi:dihydropteroate synthase